MKTFFLLLGLLSQGVLRSTRAYLSTEPCSPSMNTTVPGPKSVEEIKKMNKVVVSIYATVLGSIYLLVFFTFPIFVL